MPLFSGFGPSPIQSRLNHGEAKAVMQDVATYEQDQETLALLKILALGRRQVEEGKTVPAAAAFRRLRERRLRR